MAATRAMMLAPLVAVVAAASASAGTATSGGLRSGARLGPGKAEVAVASLAREPAVAGSSAATQVSAPGDHHHQKGRADRFLRAAKRHDKLQTGRTFMTSQAYLDLLLTIFFYGTLTCFYGIYYDHFKEFRLNSLESEDQQLASESGGFKHGFFDCADDDDHGSLCCVSLCCPAVRWGDTMRMGGYLRYWTAVIIYFFSGAAVMVNPCLICPLMAVGSCYRQKVRKTLRMEHDSLRTWVPDCLAYCFCPCLAIHQEARAMELAYDLHHEAVQDVREALLQSKDGERASAVFSFHPGDKRRNENIKSGVKDANLYSSGGRLH